MSIRTVTHINFQGQARAALSFYHTVFGGQQTLVTYADAGNVQNEVDAERIMWGQVASDDGIAVMAYDVPAGQAWHAGEGAFFISLRGDDAEAIRLLWARLADGATILHALAPAQWTPLYGMLRDRFGTTWVVDVAVA
ncbi:MAG: VOC family protein [Pseudomonadota bacterium]